MVIHLRVQRLPALAGRAEDGVIATHPTFHRVVQVEGRFGFLAEAFDLVVEVSGFSLVRMDAGGGCSGGGGGEEFAEDGLAAEFMEAGGDGGCVSIGFLWCHGL